MMGTMSEEVDYLIIGNGVAGVTAAETIRKADAHASIVIVSEEDHPMYSRVLLPNYIKGLIPRERVFLRKPDDYEQNGITLMRGQRAARLDTATRTVQLENGSSSVCNSIAVGDSNVV